MGREEEENVVCEVVCKRKLCFSQAKQVTLKGRDDVTE